MRPNAAAVARAVHRAGNAMLDVAGSGNFFSDRAIADYAADIWNAKPYPVN